MKLLAFLWIAFALNYVDRQMVYSMLPALRGELGFSPTELAWIGTIFLWPYTVALPIAGLLADRLRRDRLILISLALWSSATLGCSLATSTTSFLAWRAVMGVTEALYYPTALALISAHYPEAQRSRMLGIHQSAQFAGGVLGGWYGGWAADHTGWRSAFLIAGLAGLLFGPILWRGLPASPPPVQSGGTPSPQWGFLRSSRFLLLAATFSTYCSIQWIFFAWYPTHLQDRFRMSMTDSGFASTFCVQSAIIAGILSGGYLADRLRPRWPQSRLQITAAGAFFCAPFGYLAFSSESLVLSLGCSSLFGLFAGGLSANAFSGAFDLIDPRLRGAAGGFLNMCGGLVSGGMILIAGAARLQIGFSPILWAAMIGTMLCATMLALQLRRPQTAYHQ
jgi:ACS family D-galactonate transporter-like MFS transporter